MRFSTSASSRSGERCSQYGVTRNAPYAPSNARRTLPSLVRVASTTWVPSRASTCALGDAASRVTARTANSPVSNARTTAPPCVPVAPSTVITLSSDIDVSPCWFGSGGGGDNDGFAGQRTRGGLGVHGRQLREGNPLGDLDAQLAGADASGQVGELGGVAADEQVDAAHAALLVGRGWHPDGGIDQGAAVTDQRDQRGQLFRS